MRLQQPNRRSCNNFCVGIYSLHMLETLFTLLVFMIAPFGSWQSPISTSLLVSESIAFMELQANEEGIYWTEMRPQEKGRMALVKNGETLFEKGSVRSRVHEYGGGAFCLTTKGVVYSNDEDGQLYQSDGSHKQLTDFPNRRFADGNGPYWVCEEHGKGVENFLVHVDEKAVRTIASGHDFYSSPRLCPDGKQLAYITWDFPNMQWDSSTLWLASIGEDGQLYDTKWIAGGPNESVCHPQWSADGVLHFVSDRTGYWNLYAYKDEESINLCPMEAEFGMPGWVFGRPTFSFLEDGKIACMYIVKGVEKLGLLDTKTGHLEQPDLPFTVVQNLVTYRDKVYFIGASPTLSQSIIAFDPNSGEYTLVKQGDSIPITKEWISIGEVIEYPTQDGKVGYGFFYPPKNPNFQAPEGEKPPLIVRSHGGPTARTPTSLMMQVQFWTSRGFAFLDVNYGGSTGYGREYMKRLEKNWGIVDVEDCISAAKSLADKGLVDGERLLIRGGSAGGYTTMAALAFHDVFAAGTSYYGVSDLELLYQDTHKFEAEYTDLLVGKYPEELTLIKERSPANYPEKINAPLLLLQGTEDKIVPPNQSEKIFEVLKKKGTPVGMLMFEGEGHGFCKAKNIKHALDAELYFYAKVLDIDLPEPFDPPPVEIFNLYW